jgi:membrane-associated phospholipid phosphatase
VRVSEWVAVVYFGYLLLVAAIRPPWPRRFAAAVWSTLTVALVVAVGSLPDARLTRIVRDWAPAVSLVSGYWVSGMYFVAPMPDVERRLLTFDEWLLGDRGGARVIDRIPSFVLELLEFAYFGCFLFVPGAFLTLVWLGYASVADRFWTLVLLGELGSFGMLPWIQTRPPRTLETDGAIDRRPLLLRRLNRFMVRTTSIQVNTFPSGHVAGSLATAIAVSEVLPSLAPWMLGAAILISVATVIGRYHYAADAVAGALLTLVAWAAVSAWK